MIGGIAVSYRTIERFTKDVDLALAVKNDAEAETIVNAITRAGYLVDTHLEHDHAKRLSTVRLKPVDGAEMFVDLLFASSGIEPEVAGSATTVRIAPGVSAPVATLPALISLKVLSADPKRRAQDIVDLQNLLQKASSAEIKEARRLVSLIMQRGFNRNINLLEKLDEYTARFLDE